jgi:enterobactin synthetase component F
MLLRQCRDARGAVLFVPPVVGSSSCYVAVARALVHAEAYGLFAPGLLDGGEPVDDIGALVRAFAAAAAERVPDVPVYLAGWSLGGALALPVAEALAARGADVRHVFLLDPPLPSEQAARRAELPSYLALLDALHAELGRALADDVWRQATWPTPAVLDLLTRLRVPWGAEAPARIRKLAVVQGAYKTAFAAHEFRPYGGAGSLLAADHGDATEAGFAEWAALLPDLALVRIGGRHSSFVYEPANVARIAAYLDGVVVATGRGSR